MNWKKIIAIVAGLALMAYAVYVLKSNKEIAQGNVYQFDKEQAISVQADTIHLEHLNDEGFYAGTFEPNKETRISAEIQGKINKILVDIGSTVQRGQAMVHLDNTLLKLQLQSIDVQIEGLEADVNRYTILAKADAIQGVQLEKAVLGLKAAKVQRATVVEQINKTTIKAPFGGIVTAKLSEEGAFAAPGVALLQITDISQLKFTANVSENELGKFSLNQTYSLVGDAYPEISLTGKATMVGSKANMGSSFPIQFTVKNTPDMKIKSGMFGKVYLKDGSQEAAIIIESSAIQGTTSQPQVYLIQKGKAVLQQVVVSQRLGNKAVISAGVKEGDVLISGGFINLFDGANVIAQ